MLVYKTSFENQGILMQCMKKVLTTISTNVTKSSMLQKKIVKLYFLGCAPWYPANKICCKNVLLLCYENVVSERPIFNNEKSFVVVVVCLVIFHFITEQTF